jgi:hypothetical protein
MVVTSVCKPTTHCAFQHLRRSDLPSLVRPAESYLTDAEIEWGGAVLKDTVSS